MTSQKARQIPRRECDTFDCAGWATYRADWTNSGGFFCGECAERLRLAGDNVISLGLAP